jgi:hypothetical protein
MNARDWEKLLGEVLRRWDELKIAPLEQRLAVLEQRLGLEERIARLERNTEIENIDARFARGVGFTNEDDLGARRQVDAADRPRPVQ